MWYLYLLWNSRLNRTYLGVTTDPKRRLRQHNKEIKGGAKSTSKGAPDWQMFCMIEGFGSQSEVMRWEKIIKLRCKGLESRAMALKELTWGKCPKGKQYSVPTGLIDHWSPYERNEDYL